MNKKKSPLRNGEVSNLRKKVSAIFFIALMSSVTIFYPLNVQASQNNTTQPITTLRAQKRKSAQEIKQECMSKVINNGFHIVSCELNKEAFFKEAPKITGMTYIKDRELYEKLYRKNLDIKVSSVRLKFKDDVFTYSFKDNQQCEMFLNQLKTIAPLKEYEITEGVQDYRTISSIETQSAKIKQVKLEEEARIERERQAAEAKKKAEEEEKKRLEAIAAQRKRRQMASRSLPNGSRGGSYCFPLANYTYISSRYGPRNGGMHTGVDFAAPKGTHIYSWKSGRVVFAGWQGAYGNFIIIDHGNGLVSRYAHCSGFAVKKGQSVSQGQVIGFVGTTGNSTGNHLHFEIRVNNQFQNPLNYVRPTK